MKKWCPKCKKAIDLNQLWDYCPVCGTKLTIKQKPPMLVFGGANLKILEAKLARYIEWVCFEDYHEAEDENWEKEIYRCKLELFYGESIWDLWKGR